MDAKQAYVPILAGRRDAVIMDEMRTAVLASAEAQRRQMEALQRALREVNVAYVQAYGRAITVVTTAAAGVPWRRSAVAAMALTRAHQRAPRYGREVVHAQVLGGGYVRPRAVVWRGQAAWRRRGSRWPLRGRKRSAALRRARRHRR